MEPPDTYSRYIYNLSSTCRINQEKTNTLKHYMMWTNLEKEIDEFNDYLKITSKTCK